MTPTPTLACGYVRGSTVEQLDTLTAQGDKIRDYCQYRQLTLRGEREGAGGPLGDSRASDCWVDSGTSGSVPFYERPIATAMVVWMAAHGVKHLIISKLDRGFRDALDCLFTVSDLAKKGITLHILDLELDMSTPVGKMVLTVLAAIAEMENKRRSERQRDAFRVRKAENKVCGTVPYGYTLAADEVTLEPYAYEQRTLARLLTGDLSACSCNEAARRLNAAGIPAKRGGRWFGATVASIQERATAKAA
jgi:DNA invertase Pin-like site-specific DNA recombinase